ncbi:hypothetical protein X975_18788, partial [Stegodyphus mimosarum]
MSSSISKSFSHCLKCLLIFNQLTELEQKRENIRKIILDLLNLNLCLVLLW